MFTIRINYLRFSLIILRKTVYFISVSQHVTVSSLFHCYNTRQNDHFHIYTVLSDLGKKSVKYKGSKLWNALPSDVKDIKK